MKLTKSTLANFSFGGRGGEGGGASMKLNVFSFSSYMLPLNIGMYDVEKTGDLTSLTGEWED